MPDDIDETAESVRAEAQHTSIESFEDALSLRLPGEHHPLAINRIYRRLVPRWHFAMLNDAERNRAFHAALRAQLQPDQLVLDVGAGSGLLAMMAVRAGARAAVSCEVLEPVAHVARRIVAANGLSGRVTIVPKSSFELRVGRELPGRADILVTETIDCGLLGEGILPIVNHAREHLLRGGARIIPAGARVMFALLESSAIHHNNFAFEAGDFDVSLFNRFSSREYFPVRLSTWSHALLSDPAVAFELDFQSASRTTGVNRVPIEIRRGGAVHGVVFWFELELGAGIRLSNAPHGPSSHWMQAIQCFEVPVRVERGATAIVEAAHDATSIRFTLHR